MTANFLLSKQGYVSGHQLGTPTSEIPTSDNVPEVPPIGWRGHTNICTTSHTKKNNSPGYIHSIIDLPAAFLYRPFLVLILSTSLHVIMALKWTTGPRYLEHIRLPLERAVNTLSRSHLEPPEDRELFTTPEPAILTALMAPPPVMTPPSL